MNYPLVHHPVTPGIPVARTDIALVIDRAGNMTLFVPTDRGRMSREQQLLQRIARRLNRPHP